ncbi:hypothetical protein [Thermococcus cleftensis]|nr:hypothetical protein [Thermococcus cleftensis]
MRTNILPFGIGLILSSILAILVGYPGAGLFPGVIGSLVMFP